MIGTINSIVSKVVGTVSGPIYAWGPKPAPKAPAKAAKSAKASKAKAKKCKNCKKKCKCN